jgi:hypothetical protein
VIELFTFLFWLSPSPDMAVKYSLPEKTEGLRMDPGFGTSSVALATMPTVVAAFFSHIFAARKRKSQAAKSIANGGPGGGPEDQLSYEEGLKVIKKFLDFSSHHGIEEVQAFTAMPLPTPRTWCVLQSVWGH